MLRGEPGLGRSAEQEQFGAALHELLARPTCRARPGPGRPGTGRPGLAVWRAAGRARASPALAVPERHGGARGQPARPGRRLRGARASRGAGAGGRVARGRPGAAGRTECGGGRAAGHARSRQPVHGLAGRAGGWRAARHAGRAAPAAVRGGRRRGRPGAAGLGAARCGWPAPGPSTGRWTRPGWLARSQPAERLAGGAATAGPAGRAHAARHAGQRGAAARRGPRAAGGQRAACHAAGPVRPADRRVPGGQAPAGRRGHRAGVRPAAAGRGRCRGRDGWRRQRYRPPGRVRGQGGLRRRGVPGGPDRAAGTRGDRLHRGTRPQPVAGQGARAGPGLGQPGRAPGRGAGRSALAAAGDGPGAGIDQTAEQRALRDAVRSLLARRQEPADGDGPGYDPELWRRLCHEIGVAGLAVPERYGGAGRRAGRDTHRGRGTRP